MAKFIIKDVPTGIKFDFNTGDATVASSEVYNKMDSCKNGVESVKKNASVANFEDLTVEDIKTAPNPKFELFMDRAGKFRFRLKARNGEIIAASRVYADKASCRADIDAMRSEAPESEVIMQAS